MAPWLADTEAVEERLWQLPHRPGGGVVEGGVDTGAGLSTSGTAVSGGFRPERAWAVSFRSFLAGDAYDSGVVVHVTNEIELGGGASDRGAQFQGSLATALLGGYQLRVGAHHGPLLRGGVDFRLTGNDVMYRSLLELPRADLGWQYLAGRWTVLEIAGTAGLGLTGRNDLSGGERKLDTSLVVGAIASLRAGPLRFSGSFTHVIPPGVGGAADWLEFQACAHARTLLVCARGAWQAGDVLDKTGAVASASAAQAGIVLGWKKRR